MSHKRRMCPLDVCQFAWQEKKYEDDSLPPVGQISVFSTADLSNATPRHVRWRCGSRRFGLVRGFPVFCIGTGPQVTAKSDPGEVDVPITCGGIVVQLGDYVVGDEDGVVVMPVALISEITENKRMVIAREKILRERVAAGETTYEIFELSHLYGNQAKDRSGSDV